MPFDPKTAKKGFDPVSARRRNKGAPEEVIRDFILKIEGGYVNDPDDTGGETKFGISKRSYPNLDIPSLTIDQAVKIGKQDFWDALALSKIRDPNLREKIFDIAFNAGPSQATKLVQRATGINPDGFMGDDTLEAINMSDSQELLKSISEHQKDFYEGLIRKNPVKEKYRKSWMNRAETVGMGMGEPTSSSFNPNTAKPIGRE